MTFKTTLLKALNSADRVYMDGREATVTLSDEEIIVATDIDGQDYEAGFLPSLEIEIGEDADGFARSVPSIEGEVQDFEFVMSRPMTEGDLK